MVSEALQDPKNAELSADEVWQELHDAIANDIHWRLESRVSVPFYENVPSIVKHAALIFACEAVYQRRKITPKDNPYTPLADELRKKLDDIGAGNASIGASMDERSSSAIIISEPTKAVSHGGKLSI